MFNIHVFWQALNYSFIYYVPPQKNSEYVSEKLVELWHIKVEQRLSEVCKELGFNHTGRPTNRHREVFNRGSNFGTFLSPLLQFDLLFDNIYLLFYNFDLLDSRMFKLAPIVLDKSQKRI